MKRIPGTRETVCANLMFLGIAMLGGWKLAACAIAGIVLFALIGWILYRAWPPH